MSIFGNMFEDDAPNAGHGKGGRQLRVDLKIPPPPRLSSGLCGIYNQGATCYLNSLLQTLIMTSEFREALFYLGEDDLGKLEDKDKPGSRVRVIPLHLQKLFVKVLLSDQQGANTSQLTDSFGWTNSEEMQQHDVQELNRILFSAIEDSLVGTPGQDLIKNLYHGAIVNKIICHECSRISEREEDFLDLCLAVAGHGRLEESLETSYIHQEFMEGRNQYRCDTCNKLVDAHKGAKIRHMPSILTLSLLRFSFDYQKMQRYKETGRFSFPTTLNMSPYCEKESVGDDAIYDLFSVVIHSGSTHGGHYHAYLRDVDGLGCWTHPDEEEIRLPANPATGKVDFIEFETPLELLMALVSQHGPGGVAIDKLCSNLTKQTGVSWNKRFKKQYGPINRFLKKHDDKFHFDLVSNYVKMKACTSPPVSPIKQQQEGESSPNTRSAATAKPVAEVPRPAAGHCWFDFDDSRVRPITELYLEKQFLGKESAYMLFYRKRSMTRPTEAYNNVLFAVPEHLVSEVLDENVQLDKDRAVYEAQLNTIDLEVHFGTSYSVQLGALKPLPESVSSITISFDRRKTIEQLRTAVKEVGGVLLPPGEFVVHHAKELPAGLHLYKCLTDDPSQTVMQTPLADRSKIFAWDGKQVCRQVFPIGAEMEPVLLTITYDASNKFSHGFPKTLLISELRQLITEASGIRPENLALSRVVTIGSSSTLLALLEADAGHTLADLQVVDGDHFIAEDRSVTGNSVAESAMARQSLLISLVVENRCIDPTQEFVVEISKTSTVSDLKSQIVTQMSIMETAECRLRVDDENHGLRTPLYEQQTMTAAGLQQGMHLIVEPGHAPAKNQLTVYVTHHHPATTWMDQELIVDNDITVGGFLLLILAKAGLAGDEWHLRRTNWYGEAAQVLDAVGATLSETGVLDGHKLLLAAGRLPPHGHILLPVWLLPPPAGAPSGEQDESMLAWIASSIHGLLGGSAVPAGLGGGKPAGQLVLLGELQLSKDLTLRELKLRVLKLPELLNLRVPLPNHLRVRVLEHGNPTTVLRIDSTTLHRLKLTSASQVGIQILPHEEELNQNHTVLCVVVRTPGQRAYGPPADLVWDLTRGGAAPAGLRAAVGQLLALPAERLAMAKYNPDKYEWMVLRDGNGKSTKAKKKGQGKVNLRHAPFHIKDGDVIGVKVLEPDVEDNDDFMTDEDVKGRQRLQEEAEQRHKRREEKRGQDDLLTAGFAGPKRNARREVGIKIHVADFR